MSGGWWIALITTGCFCVLASFSTGKYHPDARPQRSSLSAFMAEKLNTYVPNTAKVTNREQAEAYARVYGITDDNINSYKDWW